MTRKQWKPIDDKVNGEDKNCGNCFHGLTKTGNYRWAGCYFKAKIVKVTTDRIWVKSSCSDQVFDYERFYYHPRLGLIRTIKGDE